MVNKKRVIIGVVVAVIIVIVIMVISVILFWKHKVNSTGVIVSGEKVDTTTSKEPNSGINWLPFPGDGSPPAETEHNFSICENDWPNANFSCPGGKIKMKSTKYGRYDLGKCSHPTASANQLCDGKDMTRVLELICDGRENCNLQYVPTKPDPCPGIYKQLTGSFVCQLPAP